VFDTNFTADLTIMEEATEFVTRLTKNGTMPMFTSCCPGWINLVEKTYPTLTPHLSTCKSPQAMMSTLTKTYFAKKLGVSPRDVKVVSIMPCVAKKDEMNRPQLAREELQKDGYTAQKPDTDYVLTTREFGHLLKEERIPFMALPDEDFDEPLGVSTGAAALFGATGGVMEAALRTANFMVTGNELKDVVLHDVRKLTSGHHNLRETTVNVGGIDLNVAVVTGTKNVRKVAEEVLAGTSPYHLIEVMACPGGCVGGGGEPKIRSIDGQVVKKRIAAIREIDGTSKIRLSHKNVAVQSLYE
jgi:NADH-quinone oxidoreductase subunit G